MVGLLSSGAGGSKASESRETMAKKISRGWNSLFKAKPSPTTSPPPPEVTVAPIMNPEDVTEQKREWIETQVQVQTDALATWPEHIFEHFVVVGLSPLMEMSQLAEDLCSKERRQGTGNVTSDDGYYDKAPKPAYDAEVLFRHPVDAPCPVSDQELCDLCFPHKVVPQKLKRSPSWSSLNEVIYGRFAHNEDKTFIFLLKVGNNLPLFGVCMYAMEIVHRPPHMARHLFPQCRAPYRSCLISAPRCYCLLSHYPFFELHFQVLTAMLGMERLHRTIDFNHELEANVLRSSPSGLTSSSMTQSLDLRRMASFSVMDRRSLPCMEDNEAASQAYSEQLLSSTPSNDLRVSHTAGAAGGTAGMGSMLMRRASTKRTLHDSSMLRPSVSLIVSGAVGASGSGRVGSVSRLGRSTTQDGILLLDCPDLNETQYCVDCASVIADMYPGILAPRVALRPQLQHTRSLAAMQQCMLSHDIAARACGAAGLAATSSSASAYNMPWGGQQVSSPALLALHHVDAGLRVSADGKSPSELSFYTPRGAAGGDATPDCTDAFSPCSQPASGCGGTHPTHAHASHHVQGYQASPLGKQPEPSGLTRTHSATAHVLATSGSTAEQYKRYADEDAEDHGQDDEDEDVMQGHTRRPLLGSAAGAGAGTPGRGHSLLVHLHQSLNNRYGRDGAGGEAELGSIHSTPTVFASTNDSPATAPSPGVYAGNECANEGVEASRTPAEAQGQMHMNLSTAALVPRLLWLRQLHAASAADGSTGMGGGSTNSFHSTDAHSTGHSSGNGMMVTAASYQLQPSMSPLGSDTGMASMGAEHSMCHTCTVCGKAFQGVQKRPMGLFPGPQLGQGSSQDAGDAVAGSAWGPGSGLKHGLGMIAEGPVGVLQATTPTLSAPLLAETDVPRAAVAAGVGAPPTEALQAGASDSPHQAELQASSLHLQSQQSAGVLHPGQPTSSLPELQAGAGLLASASASPAQPQPQAQSQSPPQLGSKHKSEVQPPPQPRHSGPGKDTDGRIPLPAQFSNVSHSMLEKVCGLPEAAADALGAGVRRTTRQLAELKSLPRDVRASQLLQGINLLGLKEASETNSAALSVLSSDCGTPKRGPGHSQGAEDYDDDAQTVDVGRNSKGRRSGDGRRGSAGGTGKLSGLAGKLMDGIATPLSALLPSMQAAPRLARSALEQWGDSGDLVFRASNRLVGAGALGGAVAGTPQVCISPPGAPHRQLRGGLLGMQSAKPPALATRATHLGFLDPMTSVPVSRFSHEKQGLAVSAGKYRAGPGVQLPSAPTGQPQLWQRAPSPAAAVMTGDDASAGTAVRSAGRSDLNAALQGSLSAAAGTHTATMFQGAAVSGGTLSGQQVPTKQHLAAQMSLIQAMMQDAHVAHSAGYHTAHSTRPGEALRLRGASVSTLPSTSSDRSALMQGLERSGLSWYTSATAAAVAGRGGGGLGLSTPSDITASWRLQQLASTSGSRSGRSHSAATVPALASASDPTPAAGGISAAAAGRANARRAAKISLTTIGIPESPLEHQAMHSDTPPFLPGISPGAQGWAAASSDGGNAYAEPLLRPSPSASLSSPVVMLMAGLERLGSNDSGLSRHRTQSAPPYLLPMQGSNPRTHGSGDQAMQGPAVMQEPEGSSMEPSLLKQQVVVVQGMGPAANAASRTAGMRSEGGIQLGFAYKGHAVQPALQFALPHAVQPDAFPQPAMDGNGFSSEAIQSQQPIEARHVSHAIPGMPEADVSGYATPVDMYLTPQGSGSWEQSLLQQTATPLGNTALQEGAGQHFNQQQEGSDHVLPAAAAAAAAAESMLGGSNAAASALHDWLQQHECGPAAQALADAHGASTMPASAGIVKASSSSGIVRRLRLSSGGGQPPPASHTLLENTNLENTEGLECATRTDSHAVYESARGSMQLHEPLQMYLHAAGQPGPAIDAGADADARHVKHSSVSAVTGSSCRRDSSLTLATGVSLGNAFSQALTVEGRSEASTPTSAWLKPHHRLNTAPPLASNLPQPAAVTGMQRASPQWASAFAVLPPQPIHLPKPWPVQEPLGEGEEAPDEVPVDGHRVETEAGQAQGMPTGTNDAGLRRSSTAMRSVSHPGRAEGSVLQASSHGINSGFMERDRFSPIIALDQLYRQPVLHPGEVLSLKFGGISMLQYVRPMLPRRYTVIGATTQITGYAEAELAESLQHWTVVMLCRCLSLDSILTLLSALLLEQQVVVFCQHMSVLSAIVLAIMPLMRPFKWQSLVMPVLPVSMLGFLDAPVPFLLGVQYKTSDIMARCVGHIRVNVYKDRVKAPPLPPLPGGRRLAAALTPHHAALRRVAGMQGPRPLEGPSSHGHGGTAGAVIQGHPIVEVTDKEQALAGAFLSELRKHLNAICGDLRPHVITNVGMDKRTGVLMKDSLLASTPPRDRAFVRQLMDTQHFSVWSDALINANFEASSSAVFSQ